MRRTRTRNTSRTCLRPSVHGTQLAPGLPGKGSAPSATRSLVRPGPRSPLNLRLPSRSRGDDTSFVWFDFAICCKRCELRHGRVIEFRDGFAFLGRDGELYTVVMDVGADLLVAEIGRAPRFDGVKQVVYAVNTETLERTKVER